MEVKSEKLLILESHQHSSKLLMTMTTGAVVKPQSANTEGHISYNGGDTEAPNKAPSYNSVGHVNLRCFLNLHYLQGKKYRKYNHTRKNKQTHNTKELYELWQKFSTAAGEAKS